MLRIVVVDNRIVTGRFDVKHGVQPNAAIVEHFERFGADPQVQRNKIGQELFRRERHRTVASAED